MKKIQLKSSKPQRWKPHDYQKKAVKFLQSRQAGGLFLEPGLGKTSITLEVINSYIKEGVVKKVLIIAPLRVCYNVWPEEIKRWSNFNSLRCCILHGRDKDKLLASDDYDIYLINPEGLKWLFDAQKITSNSFGSTKKAKIVVDQRRWEKFGFDMLVVDELSKFKSSTSDRFKMIKPLINTFRFRYGLTGSPAANGLINLFGQMYIIDNGLTFGQYITHFRNAYFESDYLGFTYTIREGAEKEIYEAIKPFVLSMKATDYLDMPDYIESNIYVEMDKKAHKIYEALEEDLITKLENNTVTAATAGAASIKCRQVANGAVYVDPEVEALVKTADKEWASVHDEKIDALLDLIDELQGKPLLVAYEFAHDLERLKKALGKDTPHIGTGVSMKETQRIVNDFNKGRIPVLLGHPASMGHGLNMQDACNHVCWFSITWDYELYDQFVRRVYRQGNKQDKVFIYRIVCKDTIDNAIVGMLSNKTETQNALFKALESMKRRRKKL